MSWLLVMNIIDRMAAFDLNGFAGSHLTVTEEDNVIGEMGEPLRRLFGLYLGAQERVKTVCAEYQALSSELELAVSERGGVSSEDDVPKQARLEELSRQYSLAVQEADSFKGIFWGAMRLEFPVLLTKNCFCALDGFKVSWRDVVVGVPVYIGLASPDTLDRSPFGRG